MTSSDSPPLPSALSPSPITTVRTTARLALPPGSRLVAGGLGLERPVRGVQASRATPPLWVAPDEGEVLLLDLIVVQAGNPGLTLARVVREMGRLRVAAIAVRGLVETAARYEAERGNLPLFRLPEESDIGRVARAILRLLQDPEEQEEAQAAVLYRYLSQGVAAGEGVSELVETLHVLSGHAVMLRRPDGATLAQAGEAQTHGEEWTHTLGVSGGEGAVLALRDEPGRLDTFARLALEQGAAALALALARQEAVAAAREGALGDWVAGLLAGEADGALTARARAAEFPLDATQWAVVAVGGEQGVAGWASRAVAHVQTLGWTARTHLAPGEWPMLGRGWQATLLVAGGTEGWEGARSTFWHELSSGTEGITLGAGEAGRGLEGLRQALSQARAALELGLRLGGPGRGFLHRELGLYRLLRHLSGTTDLHTFLKQTLIPLEQYDAEHGSELLPTLRALLAAGGNVSATAKHLHLHRNSLLYRIERIREVAGLDPADPDAAFTLALALRLAPLR